MTKETQWLTALLQTPSPEEGSLTRAALAQQRPAAAFSLPLRIGGVAVAATVSVIAWQQRPTPRPPVRIVDVIGTPTPQPHPVPPPITVVGTPLRSERPSPRPRHREQRRQAVPVPPTPAPVLVAQAAPDAIRPSSGTTFSFPQDQQLAFQGDPWPVLGKPLPATAVTRDIVLQGTPPAPLTIAWNGNDYRLVTLGTPQFVATGPARELQARLTATLLTFDKATFTVHGALFDAQGNVLRTAQASCATPRLWVGKPLQTTQEVALFFGSAPSTAVRYQLTISRTPLQNPDQWNQPSYTLVVGRTYTDTDGSLVLEPHRPELSPDIYLREPTVRDYTRIRLAPELAPLAPPSLIGTTVRATGKTTPEVFLTFPAIAVNTVEVTKADQLVITPTQPQEPVRWWVIPPLGLSPLQPAPTTITLAPHVLQRLSRQAYLQSLREARRRGETLYDRLIEPAFEATLLAAAADGDEASVIELIQQGWFGGPERAPQGGNGVTWAAAYANPKLTTLLLERGLPAGIPDSGGNTGLHRTFRTEIAQQLIERKAPLEVRNQQGETPLLAQARQSDLWLGHEAVARLLLERGAQPDCRDNDGRTPLMWAAQNGLVGLVEALLRSGATPGLKDRRGKRAYDYIAPWDYQRAPGFITVERLAELKRRAEADQETLRQLLRQP